MTSGTDPKPLDGSSIIDVRNNSNDDNNNNNNNNNNDNNNNNLISNVKKQNTISKRIKGARDNRTYATTSPQCEQHLT